MSDYIKRLRNKIGKDPFILVGASILAKDDQGRILLQFKNDTDNWGLPGGTMKLGETIKETACRKLYEEIGIMAEDLKLTNIFSGEDFHNKLSGNSTYNLIVLYEAFGISDEIFPKNESLEVKYLDPEEVSNLEDRTLKILSRLGIIDKTFND